MSITFDNPTKACFFIKNYPLINNSNMHNKIYFDIFFYQKTVFIRFLMVIDVQNQLPINFGLLQDINDMKFYPHTHEFLTFNINQSIYIK